MKTLNKSFSFLLFLSLAVFATSEASLANSSEGKEKNSVSKKALKDRKPASQEEGKCYANIGIVGTLKGVIRESEEILYLKDCLKHSSSEAVFEIPSTLPGAVPRHFIAKVKAKEVPFFFRMGSFTYHILEGNIIGVTQVER